MHSVYKLCTMPTCLHTVYRLYNIRVYIVYTLCIPIPAYTYTCIRVYTRIRTYLPACGAGAWRPTARLQRHDFRTSHVVCALVTVHGHLHWALLCRRLPCFCGGQSAPGMCRMRSAGQGTGPQSRGLTRPPAPRRPIPMHTPIGGLPSAGQVVLGGRGGGGGCPRIWGTGGGGRGSKDPFPARHRRCCQAMRCVTSLDAPSPQTPWNPMGRGADGEGVGGSRSQNVVQ